MPIETVTTNFEEAPKPPRLKIWISSIRHIILWKFSKQYRIAVMAFWAVNPNSEIGIFTISSYGPKT